MVGWLFDHEGWTSLVVLLLLWRLDQSSSSAMCNDTLYAEDCDTWLSGRGTVDVQPICYNGTIIWHNGELNNMVIRMTRYKAFRMCLRLERVSYNVTDTTNRRNIPRPSPMEGRPTCVLSRPGGERRENIEVEVEPATPGSKFIINIPFTVRMVRFPGLPYSA